MDVTPIANVATDMMQTRVAAEAETAALTKAIDVQAAGVIQLLQTAADMAPQVAVDPSDSGADPGTLGSQIDTFA